MKSYPFFSFTDWAHVDPIDWVSGSGLSETSLSRLGANFMVSIMGQTDEAIFQGTRKNAFPILK